MSLQAEYNTFNHLASCGSLCKGDSCPGWFVSDFDTVHECPCNRDKGYPHPEDNEPQLFVITALLNGEPWAIALYRRKDLARQTACRMVDRGWRDLRLRRIRDKDQIERAEFQIEKYRDWASDHGHPQ